MRTQYISALEDRENGAKLAGSILRSGGLVAFPTETVYGLGANGLDAAAVKRIFAAKGRPADNPLILHVADRADAKALWMDVSDVASRLMDAFWPGPLTLIDFKGDAVPDAVTAGLDTVALRMPDHPTALGVIREATVPVAAPSANASGRPSPTTAGHVLADMDGRIDLVIDGGPCAVGLESTVLSIAGEPTILRPGAITKEMLEAVIGAVHVADAVLRPLGEGEIALSPGMKHRHYAPDCEVAVAIGTPEAAAGRIVCEYGAREALGQRCIIFATKQTEAFYRGKRYAIIGDRDEPITLCRNLFSMLRTHSAGADVILCEALPDDELGLAYMNRLLRASGFNILG